MPASDSKPREIGALENRVRLLEAKLGISVDSDTLVTGDAEVDNFQVNGDLDAATGTTNLGASVFITGLPSADPHVVGQLYTATAAVKVSAG